MKAIVKMVFEQDELTIIAMSDKITCVPKRCFKMMKQELLMCAALKDQLTTEQICAIYQRSEHPGVQCTTYFIGRVSRIFKDHH